MKHLQKMGSHLWLKYKRKFDFYKHMLCKHCSACNIVHPEVTLKPPVHMHDLCVQPCSALTAVGCMAVHYSRQSDRAWTQHADLRPRLKSYLGNANRKVRAQHLHLNNTLMCCTQMLSKYHIKVIFQARTRLNHIRVTSKACALLASHPLQP